MQDASIRETVRRFIIEEFLPGESPDRVTDRLPLITGGILDSLATLKLVAFLEETYRIQLEAHEVGADNLDSIQAIARFVQEKQG